jgi:hypothetical protein
MKIHKLRLKNGKNSCKYKTNSRECNKLHKDHDFTNNRLDNLEYVTPRQNTRKAVEHYGKHHWCYNKT